MSQNTSKPILVLGIGNLLLSDEGVGVHTVQQMAAMALPDTVELVDGGTLGPDLVDLIAGRSKVIVVDAADIDGPPGTILRFGPEDLIEQRVALISLHQVGLAETLQMARHLGLMPQKMVIIGVRPDTLSLSLELSPAVAAVMPAVIKAVLEEIDEAL